VHTAAALHARCGRVFEGPIITNTKSDDTVAGPEEVCGDGVATVSGPTQPHQIARAHGGVRVRSIMVMLQSPSATIRARRALA
jgi:hypothetical protein